jgi:hypothetical protein
MIGDLFLYTISPKKSGEGVRRMKRYLTIRYKDAMDWQNKIAKFLETPMAQKAHRILFVDPEAKPLILKDRDKEPEHTIKTMA